MEYILSQDCYSKRIFKESQIDGPLIMGIGCACTGADNFACMIGLVRDI